MEEIFILIDNSDDDDVVLQILHEEINLRNRSSFYMEIQFQ